jgi:transposase
LKIFATIELYCARFLYHFQTVFNAETYIDYLERTLRSYSPRKIYLIQDNASYHKDSTVWTWFSEHRKHMEVFNLPAYSPQLNAVERIWHHARLHGTHNRYFATQDRRMREIEGQSSQGKGIKSGVGFLNGDFKVKVQHRRYRGVMARKPNLAPPLLAVLPRSAGDSFEVQRR